MKKCKGIKINLYENVGNSVKISIRSEKILKFIKMKNKRKCMQQKV